ICAAGRRGRAGAFGWHSICSLLHSMEFALQRGSWIGSVIAALLCAYLAAGVVNSFAPIVAAPRLSPRASIASPAPDALAGPPLPRASLEETDVRQVSADGYVVAKKTIDEVLSDPARLATQARVTAWYKDGVAAGFRIFAVAPGSLFARIGLQNGDVIRRIGGY